MEDFFKMYPPKHVLSRPRVLFISEKPVFASIISDKVLEQIQDLELKNARQGDSSKAENGLKVETANALAKAAMILSHASSIAIATADKNAPNENLSVLSIIKATMAKKDKEVILMVQEGRVEEWEDIISSCVEKGKLRRAVGIVQLASDDDVNIMQRVSMALLSLDGLNDENKAPHKLTAVIGPGKQGNRELGFIVTCL